MFFDQFKDFLVLILVVAAAVSFVVGMIWPDEGISDTLVILAILILNAFIGVSQEHKAILFDEPLVNEGAPGPAESPQPLFDVTLDRQPLVIPPTLGKPFLKEHPELCITPETAFKHLREANRVVFLGYSLPTTDLPVSLC